MSSPGFVEVVTPAVSEPVSVSELKGQLRLQHDLDDVELSRYIRAAREYAEGYQRRQLMPATLRLWLDEWPCLYPIELQCPPLISVTSIVYFDVNGVSQTLDPSKYQVAGGGAGSDELARITPAYGEVWPTVRYQMHAIVIEYQAGYANAASVPETTRQGILIAAAAWAEMRKIGDVPSGVEALLDMERIKGFG